jgi:hypothetical protein
LVDTPHAFNPNRLHKLNPGRRLFSEHSISKMKSRKSAKRVTYIVDGYNVIRRVEIRSVEEHVIVILDEAKGKGIHPIGFWN